MQSTSIPDHIRQHIKVLFVGFNPSIISAETGHHYANRTNRFWKILYLAGLTPRLFKPEEDGKLLEFYYGFTNIVSRPTRTAAEISKKEYAEGRNTLKQKIELYLPLVICFVGKGVYEEFSSSRSISWGVQVRSVVPGVIEFVAPSTSGLVRMKLDEVVEIFRQLTDLMLKEEVNVGSKVRRTSWNEADS